MNKKTKKIISVIIIIFILLFGYYCYWWETSGQKEKSQELFKQMQKEYEAEQNEKEETQEGLWESFQKEVLNKNPQEITKPTEQIKTQTLSWGEYCPDLSVAEDRIECREDNCYLPSYSDARNLKQIKVDNLVINARNDYWSNIESGTLCKPGSKPRENINYFYCRGLWTKKTFTNSEGIVEITKKIIITLVIEKVGEKGRVIETLCEYENI